MESRVWGMEKAKKHIIEMYQAKPKSLGKEDEEILKSNVLGQFAEDIWTDDEMNYFTDGIVNSWELYQKVKDSEVIQKFVTESYEIALETGHSIIIDMEVTTGYIMISTNSSFPDDFRLLHRIQNEMILCRGILPKDVESKNMYYYHYINAKNVLKGDNGSLVDISED